MNKFSCESKTNLCNTTYKSYKDSPKILKDTTRSYRENRSFRSNSLDSLANSSSTSESDDFQDSDSDGKCKNIFLTQCEVYKEKSCSSIKSWSKSDSIESENGSDFVGDYQEKKSGSEKRSESSMARMETIPEESNEPKISVKEILARFENLKGRESPKDLNNNSQVEGVGKISSASKEVYYDMK